MSYDDMVPKINTGSNMKQVDMELAAQAIADLRGERWDGSDEEVAKAVMRVIIPLIRNRIAKGLDTDWHTAKDQYAKTGDRYFAGMMDALDGAEQLVYRS